MLKHNEKLNEIQTALSEASELLEKAAYENAPEFSRNYSYNECKRLKAMFDKAFNEYIDFLKDCN